MSVPGNFRINGWCSDHYYYPLAVTALLGITNALNRRDRRQKGMLCGQYYKGCPSTYKYALYNCAAFRP